MLTVRGSSLLVTLVVTSGCWAQEDVEILKDFERSSGPPVEIHKDGGVTAGGLYYDNIVDFQTSAAFADDGRRCATEHRENLMFFAPSDCSFDATVIGADYAPENGNVLEIPVVFHVVRRSDGAGHVSLDLLQTQLDILNEDYRALASSPGAQGIDTRIQFVLASRDPDGNRVVPVNYYEDDAWFRDPGPGSNNPMKNAIAWDPSRYFNIYTNDGAGALGYATFPSQSAGTQADGIVLSWPSVGRDAPNGGLFNQGRTATHEVGHYLGLFHTFQSGCGDPGSPYATGDRLADTQAHASPNFECETVASSCGDGDVPIENYMNYTNDTCMERFTVEQANRARCSLVHYRGDLFHTVAAPNAVPEAAFDFVVDDDKALFEDESTDADGTVVSWLWDFGDGTTSTEQEPEHRYGASGTYRVVLLVQDEEGGSSHRVREVTVAGVAPPSSTVLESGVAVTQLAAPKGQVLRFVLDVEERSDLLFQMAGGSGDADLYIRKDAPPTVQSFDHRSFKSGNSERIEFAGAAPGQYHVMVRAYAAFEGAALAATVTPSTGGFAEVPGISGAAGEQRRFYVDVPADSSNLKVAMTGGTGDADLYLRFDRQPTTAAYDYRPYRTGNEETVSLGTPRIGRWHIMVRGFKSFDDVTLRVTYD